MSFLSSRFSKVLSSFLTAAFVLSVTNFADVGTPVNAAGERSLSGEANSFKVSEILNTSDGDRDLLANPNSDVTYGDTITVKFDWSFLDTTSITTEDVFVYELPTKSDEQPVSNIVFNDVTNKDIYDGENVVGKFSISGNKIYVQYTDAVFCSQGSRHGSLSFVGKINDDGNGGDSEKDVTFHFDNYATLQIHMIPPVKDTALEVKKVFDTTATSNTDHIYDCTIRITSTGENNNVTFEDGMYPGMYLYSTPVFYTDAKLTNVLPSSRYELTQAVTGLDQREIKGKINQMSDGESVYMYYQVKIVDDLYNWTTANERSEDHTSELQSRI